MLLLEIFLSQLSITKLFGVASLCFLIHRLFTGTKESLPPLVPSLPLVGSLPFIGKHAERTFSKWAKQYGPIFRVRLGAEEAVVLNSYEFIYQAFVKQASQFSGRPRSFFSNTVNRGDYGLILLNSEEKWKIQRRFGCRVFSKKNLAGRGVERRVLEEANFLCEVIRSKEGRPFVLEKEFLKMARDIHILPKANLEHVVRKNIATSMANVIHGVTMSESAISKGNEKLKEDVTRQLEGFRKNGFFWILLSVAPWCRFLAPFRKKYAALLEHIRFGEDLYGKFIKKHEESCSAQPTDFVELYLKEAKRGSPTFERRQLLRYLQDLTGAGTETSTSTIRWILLHLIKQPKIQERIHDEIDHILGRDGVISSDMNLPYTKAVIQEAFRIETAVPLSVPRRTRQDVKLMSYLIPKNTQVIPNLWHVHNDPGLWPDPRRFDPERHLDKEGKFKMSNKVIPFSVGPRNCLGENLARMEIFIFVVCILQKFEVTANPNQTEPAMEGTSGPVYSAPHYPFVFLER